MGLEDLRRGFTNPDYDLDLCSFNRMESPVPCSSDVEISPDKYNIIKKTKKRGKRPQRSEKLIWEFLQYSILNRLFLKYSEASNFDVHVPSSIAVFPRDYTLFTEFAPGFILSRYSKDVKKGEYPVRLKEEGFHIRQRDSVSYHLGVICKIKEIEGIYHSDFDLRHIIHDSKIPRASMFDLENTRFVSDRKYLVGESNLIKKLWTAVAVSRGSTQEEVNAWFEEGGEAVKIPESFERNGRNYIALSREVGRELGVDINLSKGLLDKFEVKISHPKIRR